MKMPNETEELTLNRLDKPGTEVIVNGNLFNTIDTYTKIFDNTKYRKIIYNILPSSGAGRSERTSGIIEFDVNNNPLNISSQWEIYAGTTYYIKGVVYVDVTGNVPNLLKIKMTEKGSGWSSNTPFYEMVGVLK